MKTRAWRTHRGVVAGSLVLCVMVASAAALDVSPTIHDDGYSVGIGTSDPNAKLDVYGPSAGRYALRVTGDNGAHAYGVDVRAGNGDPLGRPLVVRSFVGETYFLVNGQGQVGIGTTAPETKLDVFAPVSGVFAMRVLGDNGANAYGLKVQAGNGTAGGTPLLVTDFAGSATHLLVNGAGSVGIGTASPAAKLHVAGDAQVDGNIAAKYQDIAEWVRSAQRLPGGAVVVIDETQPNQVVVASRPYDTRVAGVVSERPGVLLGEAAEDKAKVAHSGRVKVKVDARHGPIAIGDLLVTSPTPGHAMRSAPVDLGGTPVHRPGTLLGKALEPLAAGQGEILVLLMLQ